MTQPIAKEQLSIVIPWLSSLVILAFHKLGKSVRAISFHDISKKGRALCCTLMLHVYKRELKPGYIGVIYGRHIADTKERRQIASK